MSQKSTTILIAGAIILGVILIAGAVVQSGKNSNIPNNSSQPSNNPSKYDTTTVENFAKCLTEKGLKFYGAWWCPHCQNQKELFGDAFQYVDYIECEKKPGVSKRQMTQECVDVNIEGYPTWIFADGSRQTGELSLETLSEISSCQLR